MAESTPPACHHHHLRDLHATPARHDQVSIWPGSGECETHTLSSRGLEAHYAAEVLCATTTVVEDTARWLEPARRQWAGRGAERTVTRTAGLLDAAALLRLVHELVPYQKVQRKQYGALQPTIISLTRHQTRGKCNNVVQKYGLWSSTGLLLPKRHQVYPYNNHNWIKSKFIFLIFKSYYSLF